MYTIQCMGQGIRMKSEINKFNSNCVCHNTRSMFRVLGIYNFGVFVNKTCLLMGSVSVLSFWDLFAFQ